MKIVITFYLNGKVVSAQKITAEAYETAEAVVRSYGRKKGEVVSGGKTYQFEADLEL